MVQTVLDSLPGGHSWVVPVRDAAGELVDYLTRAASPEAVDMANRANCIAQNSPAELHDFVFGGGERAAREPGDDRGERWGVERTDIFGEQSDLFQFAAGGGNRQSGLGELFEAVRAV